MKALQDKLTAFSTGQMDNPEQGIAPIRQTALDNINRSYMNVPTAVTSQLAARGYGSSGSVGNSLYRVALAKGGAQSDLEGQIAQMVNANRNQGANLGERLLNSGKGSTSTSTGPSTAGGDALMSAGNGFGNIATLLTLSKLLKGGGPTKPSEGGMGGVPIIDGKAWGGGGYNPADYDGDGYPV